jgi:hypothetical protein
VAFHKFRGDIQAQSQSRVGKLAFAFDTIKTLEEMRQFFVGDADTKVLYRGDQFMLGTCRLNLHDLGTGRVFDGIGQYLPDAIAVGV